MEILIILGFVMFSVFAVFGIINGIIQLRHLNAEHKAVLQKIEEEKDKAERERLQYLAGIKTKAEVKTVPVKLGADIVGELLTETEVELEDFIKSKPKTISAQYTRR